jgi:hypothetical protein
MATLTPAQSLYVRKETLIGIAINAALSALFGFLVFGGRDSFPPRDIILDALPQSFMIALMTTIVPTWLTRRRLRAGSVEPASAGASLLPRNLLARALVAGIVASALGLALNWLLVSQADTASWSFAALLGFKIGYGALLAALCGPLLLRRALADGDGAARA